MKQHSKDRISDALHDPSRVGWARASELLHEGTISCIDGRHEGATVAAPGGNAGELVLLLAVAEWFRGRPYGDEELERILATFIDRMGRIYIHSDDHALAHLASAVDLSVEELERQQRDSGQAISAALLDALSEPANLGCGHLAAMMANPELYRVRKGLLLGLMQKLYRRAWVGDGVELTVLHGEHGEEAVVVFHSPQPVAADTMLPMLKGENGPRVFTENVPALRFVRRKAVQVLLEVDQELSRANAAEELRLEVERLGERHLNLTVQALAPELPRYRATFRGAQELELDFE